MQVLKQLSAGIVFTRVRSEGSAYRRSRAAFLNGCFQRTIGVGGRGPPKLDAGTLRCELVHNRRGMLARESVIQRAPVLLDGYASCAAWPQLKRRAHDVGY